MVAHYNECARPFFLFRGVPLKWGLWRRCVPHGVVFLCRLLFCAAWCSFFVLALVAIDSGGASALERRRGRVEAPIPSGVGTRGGRHSKGERRLPAKPEGGRRSEAHTHRGRAITRRKQRARGLMKTPSGEGIGAARGRAGRRMSPTEHGRREAAIAARAVGGMV